MEQAVLAPRRRAYVAMTVEDDEGVALLQRAAGTRGLSPCGDVEGNLREPIKTFACLQRALGCHDSPISSCFLRRPTGMPADLPLPTPLQAAAKANGTRRDSSSPCATLKNAPRTGGGHRADRWITETVLL